MAEGKTYGILFPFRDSVEGKYLGLSNFTNDELRSSLTHLLLTKKGSRYYLPDFGTRLYEYIFEPLDGPTFGGIESDIREAVEKFIPQLQIKKITVTAASSEEDPSFVTTAGNVINRTVGESAKQTYEYTAKVRIDYVDTSSAFGTTDFIILNI
jgi:phage baseplate assembly protein W